MKKYKFLDSGSHYGLVMAVAVFYYLIMFVLMSILISHNIQIFSNNSYRNLKITQIIENQFITYNFKEFVDDYKDRIEIFNIDKDLERIRDEMTEEFLSTNTTISGYGKVHSVKKMKYNYQIKIEFDAVYDMFNTVHLWIPFGEHDEYILNLKKGEITYFLGELYKIQDNDIIVINEGEILK